MVRYYVGNATYTNGGIFSYVNRRRRIQGLNAPPPLVRRTYLVPGKGVTGAHGYRGLSWKLYVCCALNNLFSREIPCLSSTSFYEAASAKVGQHVGGPFCACSKRRQGRMTKRQKKPPHSPPHQKKKRTGGLGFLFEVLERCPFIWMPTESLGKITNRDSISPREGTFVGSGRNVGDR